MEKEKFEFSCDSCQKPVSENDKICPNCGENLEEMVEVVDSRNNTTNSFRFFLPLVGFFFYLILGMLFGLYGYIGGSIIQKIYFERNTKYFFIQKKKGLLKKREDLWAIGLIIAFFLPWVKFLGFSASGFDLAKYDSFSNLWLIPVFSGILLIVASSGGRRDILGLLTGFSVFLSLHYAGPENFAKILKIVPGDKLNEVLGIGLGLTLLFSFCLVVSSLISNLSNTELKEILLPKEFPKEFSGSETKREVSADTKTCPMCAETVKHAAKICRFCNHKFEISEEK